MSADNKISGLRGLRGLEEGKLTPEQALSALVSAATEARTTALRAEACYGLGALSGRELGVPWDIAERAAFALLSVAREADAATEKIDLLHAMGRGFRNVWLMPFVHSRLSDDDESVVAAAISAAGGLGFPALEELIAQEFLTDLRPPRLRLAAIAALGRMGAESAATRLVPFVRLGAEEAVCALSALMEIRSRAGCDAALLLLGTDPPRRVKVAAARYLAEVGREEVLPTLRALARDEDADTRIIAGLASRAWKAERKNDPDERILSALTETDRAVRSALARRLRTLPVAAVLEQAELLFSDDPEGIVQIVAEVRAPEVTRLLLRIAKDESVALAVRARAVGAIEANEAWERDALCELCSPDKGPPSDDPVRAAAARTIGAFAPPEYVLDQLAPLWDAASPVLRGALLWALQLTTRPGRLGGAERTRAEAWVKRALADQDPTVRKRAAYVAGNLDAASLVPELTELARTETTRPDLRVAAFVALTEVASPTRFADLVFLWNREDDPDALFAASRAIEKSAASAPRSEEPPPSLARAHDRLPKLLASDDARIRAAAARVAGVAGASALLGELAARVDDPSPRVREQAVIALGRCHGPEAVLIHAMSDADPLICERASEALLLMGTQTAVASVFDHLSRTFDRAAAARLAARIELPAQADAAWLAALGQSLSRMPHDDAAYEPLLVLKVRALEATRPTVPSTVGVDDRIKELFTAWPRLSAVRGFQPLAKSLRTAEMLHAQGTGGDDADLSAAIVLWMKCLEGYMHAWLGPRFRGLAEGGGVVYEISGSMLGTGWPAYQRWVAERWTDPVKMGDVTVEVPLRSMPNALRDLSERRSRGFDSPPSVTEWARIMLFFAVDHASGAKNALQIACTDGGRMVRLIHSLSVLAQVRNLVTHRAAAGVATVTAFRRAYYAAFDELCMMA